MIFVHPGKVISRNDGDIHYITFNQLCKLYGLNPNDCINADYSRGYVPSSSDKHYYPDPTGRYERNC